MKAVLTLLFCAIAFVACKPMNEKNIIAEVEQMMNAYYDDIRNEGLLAEFKYLDSTDDFYWVPPGYDSAISYDSVATVLKQNAGAYREIDNNWDVLEIVPLSKDSASYSGKLRSRMTDTSGKTVTISLLESGMVIKRKDGWKLLCGQTSIVNDGLE
jgi:hypothetical protein